MRATFDTEVETTDAVQPLDASPVTVTEIPLGDRRLREFVRVPWVLYRDDPFWTPPLTADLLGNKLLGMVGLLTPEHPYHRDSEVTHFIAHRNAVPVGRVSAAINRRFNDHYGVKIGSFGFFESVDDEAVAHALLDSAHAWIAARGMDAMRGPGEYSNATHERQGTLIDGFDTPPVVELTHNPPYHERLLESYGLRKVKDYHAYTLDLTAPPNPRLARIAEAVEERRHVTLRHADMSKLADEVHLIIELYNLAWADNWGFLPVTDEEADTLVETLRPIIDPKLVRFAYVGDEPVAVLGAFPDPNWALRPRWKWYGDSDAVRLARLFATRRRIPRVRLMFFGIKPGYRRLGVDAALFQEMLADIQAEGRYTTCDISMLLENNELILRASEFMGAKRYKTWRIWEMPVTPS